MAKQHTYNEEAVLVIETQNKPTKNNPPLTRMVRSEVVKWFALLVKNEPDKKLEDLICIAREDIKNQLIDICYNL